MLRICTKSHPSYGKSLLVVDFINLLVVQCRVEPFYIFTMKKAIPVKEVQNSHKFELNEFSYTFFIFFTIFWHSCLWIAISYLPSARFRLYIWYTECVLAILKQRDRTPSLRSVVATHNIYKCTRIFLSVGHIASSHSHYGRIAACDTYTRHKYNVCT